MIDYKTIQKAKNGDNEAIETILNHYVKKIKSFSKDEEFVNICLVRVLEGIEGFKNKKY